MTDMILERTFDSAITGDDALKMALSSEGCFSLYRVDWNQSFLDNDGRRMLCWFTAPDAESVRQAMRQLEVPEAIWPGSVHDSATVDGPPWQQANVLVERSWEEPVELADIQAIEDAGAHCLETHRVKFSRTFFSLDRKRMICLYQAPDAESVRLAQRQAGMPVDAVWACNQVRETV
jgi:hypothetical protein